MFPVLICIQTEGAERTMQKVLGNKLAIFLFVFPGILLFLLTFLAPIILSAYYSLTDTLAPGTDTHMVGLQNYKDLLTDDPRFWKSLLNALLLAARWTASPASDLYIFCHHVRPYRRKRRRYSVPSFSFPVSYPLSLFLECG